MGVEDYHTRGEGQMAGHLKYRSNGSLLRSLFHESSNVERILRLLYGVGEISFCIYIEYNSLTSIEMNNVISDLMTR